MATKIELIKKMFKRGLNGPEKIELSEEKPMKKLLLEQWDDKSDKHLEDKVDPEAMWRNIAARCWGNEENRLKAEKRGRLFRFAYATAAAVTLLLVGTWVVHVMTDSYITVTAPAERRMALTLPDSSAIWLNAGSTLRYKKEFCKDRRVMLEGEAYFDVVKMPESPFRVVFEEACVEVKGTEFSVKSQKEVAEITLFTGKIVFSAPLLKNPVEMKPSDYLLYNTKNGEVSLKHVDALEYDWRATEYRFVDKPLFELIEFLNRTYDANIIVEHTEYEYSRFTGTIRKGEPLEDVLNKVCISYDMMLSHNGETIVLKKIE